MRSSTCPGSGIRFVRSVQVEFARGDRDVFEFHLARELKMTVGEMRARMSSREYGEWIALYRLEAERARTQRRLAKAKRG